jgi:hypothetical protein
MMVEAEKLVSIHSGGACAAAAVERSKGPLEFSMVERPASTTIPTECIEGVTMSEVPLEAPSLGMKERIMIEVIGASTDVHLAGVVHSYIQPYNIFLPKNHESLSLSASNQDSHIDRAFRVCVIDFALSYTRKTGCFRREDCRRHKCYAKSHPNPLYFWAGANLYGQYGWLPRPWGKAVDWVWKIWGELIKTKYRPVKRDEADPLGSLLPLECDQGG